MLTGQAAGKYAGPAVVVSMVVAGVVSWLAALCYSSSPPGPISGFGLHLRLRDVGRVRRVDHRVGPDLEYAFGASDRGGGMVGQFISLLADFGIHFPVALSAAPGTKFVNLSGQAASQMANMRIGRDGSESSRGLQRFD